MALFFISASAAAVSKSRTPKAYAVPTMIGPGSPGMTKSSMLCCDHFGSRPPCWPSSTIDFTMFVITSGAISDISADHDR